MAGHEPFAIEPMVQRNSSDCAIVALAQVLGLPYREVSEAALKHIASPHTKGMYTSDIRRIAKTLGFTLQTIRPKQIDFDDAPSGVLVVVLTNGAHTVTLFEGVVIDPADGLVYRADFYLDKYVEKVLHLLVPHKVQK